MPLHLLKLAVGAQSVETLKAWVERSAAASKARGEGAFATITTRMAPRRADEILDGGSLYWVIKGSIQARQPVAGFEPFKDDAGIGRIYVRLKPTLVTVRPRPCRAFQGWRYLKPGDAPADWTAAQFDEDMPASMRRELMELCLI
ncbi:MAG: DUF1489 domain-containing protein [Pseudomonadota bacterium]